MIMTGKDGCSYRIYILVEKATQKIHNKFLIVIHAFDKNKTGNVIDVTWGWDRGEK